jgi:K(+)-stimulated pyrophosphate-energized sodium pump
MALLSLSIAVSVIALIFAYLKARSVSRMDPGSPRMVEISGYIAQGARAFLYREYRYLIVFAIVVAGILVFLSRTQPNSHPLVAVSFLIGGLFSALAGFFGMKVATSANVRTAQGALKGLPEAFKVAFSGGSVMGITVVGLGLLGIALLFLLYKEVFGENWERVLNVLTGFSLGASSIALFARVGGGIYTKGADVGADLVGKLEAGIPEDDPRNPAVVADNVGDNVGDVAGMGADLFESYVGSILGSMIIGVTLVEPLGGDITPLLLPPVLAGLGVLSSIVGTFFVRTREGGNPQGALMMGNIVASILMIFGSFLLLRFLLPSPWQVGDQTYSSTGIFLSILVGIVIGIGIGFVSEYFTGLDTPFTRYIARHSQTGAATNILAGISVGMGSTVIPVVLIAIGILLSYHSAYLYGVALSALGMLSITGIQLAVDAYGPIADNAGGIAEMSHLGPEVRKRTDLLDAVGNTTAAIGKGFAIASAAMTALALFSAYLQVAKLNLLDIMSPKVMSGLFLGGVLPYLFSALAISAVGKSANAMVEEVRRQFREIPGLLEGRGTADYARCVDIATRSAIKQMVLPGLLALIVPALVGYFMGKEALGGLLGGSLLSGVFLAIFMANAGGAWDNAKKMIEGGLYGGKGSDPHKSAVVGDTVGDPFKDTAGPSLNILIKLISVVSLILAPFLF